MPEPSPTGRATNRTGGFATSLARSHARMPVCEAFVLSRADLPRVPTPAPRFCARYRATAPSVGVCRGEVKAVARECGLDGEELGAVVLAVSEAASNAVVHNAGGPEDVHIDLVVELTDLEMLVTIGDTGSGLQPSIATAGLGRGLSIIATLTRHLDIRSSSAGTEVRMAFSRPGEAADRGDTAQRFEDAADRERDSARQRLHAALVEQHRLGDIFDAAVGTSTEFRAYARLKAAGEQVAARQAWLNWVENASYRGINAGPFELAAERRA
jgi:anti-sigma regulatory factor (Ser/Thr protein kinase)